MRSRDGGYCDYGPRAASTVFNSTRKLSLGSFSSDDSLILFAFRSATYGWFSGIRQLQEKNDKKMSSIRGTKTLLMCGPKLCIDKIILSRGKFTR